MESNRSFHDEAIAADALLLPKVSNKELLHRSNKHGEQAGALQLPLTTKDAAIVADAECAPPTVMQQAAAALFYATASLMVIFVNKVGVWVCLMVSLGLPRLWACCLGGVRGRAIVLSWLPYAANSLANNLAKRRAK